MWKEQEDQRIMDKSSGENKKKGNYDDYRIEEYKGIELEDERTKRL